MRFLTNTGKLCTRQAWTASLLFSFPALSLVTHEGIGLSGFLFLGSALYWWRDSLRQLHAVWPQVRWVVLAFLAHYSFTMILFSGGAIGPEKLDAPSRMALAACALLLVRGARPGTGPLWWGVAAGAVAAAFLIAWERFVFGNARPGGFMNPITFGDLSLCLALLALASAFGRRTPATVPLAVVGTVAGLAASLLTGSRGGWLVLPLALAVLLGQRRFVPRSWALALPALACLLVGLAWAIPETGVRMRITAGVGDVLRYLDGNRDPTSLSIRLELWKAALMLVRDHPMTGLGAQACKQQMQAWIALGQLHPLVLVPAQLPHMHNDALQMLATRGIPGFLAWAGVLAAPLIFFIGQLRQARSHGPHYAAALGGLLFVLAYCCFGLTEAIFWSMRACLFYAQMVFVLMGLCLNAQLAPHAAALVFTGPMARAPHLIKDELTLAFVASDPDID